MNDEVNIYNIIWQFWPPSIIIWNYEIMAAAPSSLATDAGWGLVNIVKYAYHTTYVCYVCIYLSMKREYWFEIDKRFSNWEILFQSAAAFPLFKFP